MKKVLSYEERIELAKKMILENKPVRLICKKTNFSPNKISDIRKQETGQSINSKCTKAYQAFEEYDKLGKWNSRALLEVSIRLDIPADQTLKFYNEYLSLKLHDLLRELHKQSEQEIMSLLTLHRALKENQVAEEDYPRFIQKIKQVTQLENQSSHLNLSVKNAELNLRSLNSKIIQAQKDCEKLDLQIQYKTQKLTDADREYIELNERNEKFRALVELGLKNDIKPLILELVRERQSFDKEKLLALVELLVQAVIRVAQLDPGLLNRFATVNYSEIDLHYLRVMFKNEADYYVDEWLRDPTKWRTVNPDSFPLGI